MWLREEFVCIGITLLITTSIVIAGACTNIGFVEKWFGLLAIQIPCFFLGITTMACPIFFSIQNQRKHVVVSGSESSSMSMITNPRLRLQKVLDDHLGLELFKEFLAFEFSIENILFYMRVLRFDEDFSMLQESAKYTQAVEIFHMFISSKADQCVNISFNTRKDIKDIIFPTSEKRTTLTENIFQSVLPKKYSKDRLVSNDALNTSQAMPSLAPRPEIPRDVFEQAKMEIFGLMLNDSFRRFQSNPKYQQYFQSRGF